MADVALQTDKLDPRKVIFALSYGGLGEEIQLLDLLSIKYVGTGYEDERADPIRMRVGAAYSGLTTVGLPTDVSKISGLHLVLQDMRVGDHFLMTTLPELGIGNVAVETEITVLEIIG